MKKKFVFILILFFILPINVLAFNSKSFIGGKPPGGGSNNSGGGGNTGVNNFNYLAAVPYMKVSLVKVDNDGLIEKKLSSIYYHKETFYSWGKYCNTANPNDKYVGCDYFSQLYLWNTNKIGQGKVIGNIGGQEYLTTSEKILEGVSNGWGYLLSASDNNIVTKIDWGYGTDYTSNMKKFDVQAISDYFSHEEKAKKILADLNFLSKVGCDDYSTCRVDFGKYSLVVEPVGAFCKYNGGWHSCYYATFKGFSKYVYDNFSSFSYNGFYNGYIIYDGYRNDVDNFRDFVYASGYPKFTADLGNIKKYSQNYFKEYSDINSVYGWGIIKVDDVVDGPDIPDIPGEPPSTCDAYVDRDDSVDKGSASITSCSTSGSLESSNNIFYINVLGKVKEEVQLKNLKEQCNNNHGQSCNIQLCNNSVSVKVKFKEIYKLVPTHSIGISLYSGGLLDIGYTYTSNASWEIDTNSYNGKVGAQVVYKDDSGNIKAFSDEMSFEYSYDEVENLVLNKIKNYFSVIGGKNFSINNSDNSNNTPTLSDAGSWNCSYEDNSTGRKTTCEYKLKHLTLNTSGTGFVASYSDNSTDNSVGRSYYLNKTYSSDIFKWGITTGNNNISSVNKIFDIRIATSSSDQICRAKVLNICIPPAKCDDGSEDVEPKIVYRTIDVSNPFPNNKMGEEWKIFKVKYYNSYLNRLANSYQSSNLDYSIDIKNNGNKVEIKNIEDDYNDFSKISLDGSSEFVADYFNKRNGNRCSLGEFKWGCDS